MSSIIKADHFFKIFFQHEKVNATFGNVFRIADDLSSSNARKIASVSYFLKHEIFIIKDITIRFCFICLFVFFTDVLKFSFVC